MCEASTSLLGAHRFSIWEQQDCMPETGMRLDHDVAAGGMEQLVMPFGPATQTATPRACDPLPAQGQWDDTLREERHQLLLLVHDCTGVHQGPEGVHGAERRLPGSVERPGGAGGHTGRVQSDRGLIPRCRLLPSRQLPRCIECGFSRLRSPDLPLFHSARSIQLRIEKYFLSTKKLGATYWTGLMKVGRQYRWPDGQSAGNGATSNANPYAHFAFK
jgi:hypothetical protein